MLSCEKWTKLAPSSISNDIFDKFFGIADRSLISIEDFELNVLASQENGSKLE